MNRNNLLCANYELGVGFATPSRHILFLKKFRHMNAVCTKHFVNLELRRILLDRSIINGQRIHESRIMLDHATSCSVYQRSIILVGHSTAALAQGLAISNIFHFIALTVFESFFWTGISISFLQHIQNLGVSGVSSLT